MQREQWVRPTIGLQEVDIVVYVKRRPGITRTRIECACAEEFALLFHEHRFFILDRDRVSTNRASKLLSFSSTGSIGSMHAI